MRRLAICGLLSATSLLGLSLPVCADSIWDRRDPRTSHLFIDTRARHVGDVLTILISENTVFDGSERRTSRKTTSAGSLFRIRGTGQNARQINTSGFAASLDGSLSSNRDLNGQSDFKSDRTLTDRMTVKVVAVLPNANLVVEGYRRRVVQQEERIMVVTGIVRPIDVSTNNTVQSQYVGNLTISYKGQGADTSYSQNGWLGQIMNVIWPF